MRISKRFAIALLVLARCAAFGAPGDDVKITIFVATAVQDGPIQVVGTKLPDKTGDPPIVRFHNLSNKQVQQFSVAAMVGNPEEASRFENGETDPWVAFSISTHDAITWPQEQMIAPHGYREAHSEILSSNRLAQQAQQLHSNCLHVALVVTLVHFSDGTSWTMKRNLDGEAMWKRSLQPNSTKSCEHSPAVEEALTQWEAAAGAAGYGADSPTGADPAFVSSYSIVCRLRPVGGKLAAVCPW